MSECDAFDAALRRRRQRPRRRLVHKRAPALHLYLYAATIERTQTARDVQTSLASAVDGRMPVTALGLDAVCVCVCVRVCIAYVPCGSSGFHSIMRGERK